MKARLISRVAMLMLCIALFCGWSASPAWAMANATGEAITIRITPPSQPAEDHADIEILVIDNMGIGFSRAEVRNGENESWRDITGDLGKKDDGYHGTTEIRENCTVYVRVAANDGKTYEKSRHIECLKNNPAPTAAVVSESVPASATTDADAAPDTTPRASATLTPDGQGTVLDDVSGADDKEFLTIYAQDGNMFYLVIDKQKKEDNVYFLNKVTETDLLSLAEKDTGTAATTTAIPDPEPVCICKDACIPGEVNTDCPVCSINYRNCKGAPRVLPDKQDAEPVAEKSQMPQSGAILLIIVVALAAGAAGWYFKIYRPRKEIDEAEDLEDLTGEKEETINEDDLPTRRDETRYEPEEDAADYPEYNNYPLDEPQEPGDYGM